MPALAEQSRLPREVLTSISVTKAWGLSEMAGATALLVRPRAWESMWSSAGWRGAATGSHSTL